MKQITDRVKIGSIETKNRIAVPPMVCFHWSDNNGYVTEKNIKHYHDMAKGGAGLIIAEATAVTQRSRLHDTELGLWEDGHVEGWKRLAETVHRFDTPFFVQLLHAGVSGIDPQPDTASDYLSHGPGGVEIHGHEMSLETIEKTVDDFVKAAKRAQAAGMDGIELHGCHGYLLSQFMNYNVNKRTDIYGQQKEKLALDILRAIRQECGKDFVAGIRLAAFEPTLAEGIAHAKALAQDADFLDISYGFWDGMKADKPEDFPYTSAIYGAGEIKKAVPNIPVFGVNDVVNGEMVKGVLELTDIDMVDVGRGFLVNPDFANCVLEGRPTGKCLHCQPACKYSPHMNSGEPDCPGSKLYQAGRYL